MSNELSLKALAMLRLLAATTVLLFSASIALAQNTFPGTGNVGIGTASPQSLLHVKNGAGAAESRVDGSTDSTVSYYQGATLIGRLNYQGGNVPGAKYFGFQNLAGDYLRFDSAATPMFFVTNGVSRVTITPTGNVGIGTTGPGSALTVVGDIVATGNVAAKYQDVAEWVPASEPMEEATVVVLDPNVSNHVMSSSHAYDTGVAGVISAKPGFLLGEGGSDKVMVATTGRVKVKVDASRHPIHVGDLLVTSDIAGVAMVSEPIKVAGTKMHRPGTIIGKALEPMAGGRGEILVLLSLQ